MGESIAEGTVSVWLKKVGDRVERDEPVMEIATDKVDAEIPSPAAGVLVEVLVQEGSTVEVGTVVAYVETDPSAVSSTPQGESLSAASSASATESSASSSVPSSGADESTYRPESPRPETTGAVDERQAAAPRAGSSAGSETADDRLRRRSTPLVRRIAEEHGVDLSAVDGTGRAGRITRDDVLRFVEGGEPRQRSGEGFGWDEYYSEVRHPEAPVSEGDRVEPMSRMTSLIAEHMVLSKRISPHVHSYFEIDYSRIDNVRAANRQLWAEQGLKVTYTAFILRAVARALREHPVINASISNGKVIYRSEVNIGIAVALDWGLIVPVLRRADELSLSGAARAIADLAERARRKRLSPEDVKGGTFTITNPGVFGTVLGFPILNQPQVAIMAVGAAEKRPVVITDEFGHDAIVARRRGFISLGYDHRLVNGADGDRFTSRVKELLETATAE
jgi:2-oxoglutarate dehydrogenase E2 component (dihydrolipoamide succinyltransferase)